MNRFIGMSALLLLASCSEQPVETRTSSVASEATKASEGFRAGQFQVTFEGDELGELILFKDGSYQNFYPNGEMASHGNWETAGGETCFNPAADEEEIPMCWTVEDIDSDGSFTASPGEGQPIVFTPLNLQER